jgi:hypothetical protein
MEQIDGHLLGDQRELCVTELDLPNSTPSRCRDVFAGWDRAHVV